MQYCDPDLSAIPNSLVIPSKVDELANSSSAPRDLHFGFLSPPFSQVLPRRILRSDQRDFASPGRWK
jgi:hypothetical protein